MQNKIIALQFLQPFLRTFDVLFSSFVCAPLVVVYWVTTWKLAEIFISPNDPTLSAVISLLIGFSGQFILMFFQDVIGKLLTFKNRKFINLMLSKLYALVLAQTCINFWRGVWNFVDMTSSSNVKTMALNIVQNSLIMMISKTFKNSISNPFIVATDETECDYSITTYFGRVVSK